VFEDANNLVIESKKHLKLNYILVIIIFKSIESEYG